MFKHFLKAITPSCKTSVFFFDPSSRKNERHVSRKRKCHNKQNKRENGEKSKPPAACYYFWNVKPRKNHHLHEKSEICVLCYKGMRFLKNYYGWLLCYARFRRMCILGKSIR